LTTLQALDLSNGQILSDLLIRGAQNLLGQHADSTDDQLVDWLYVSTVSRRAKPEEMTIARQILGSPRSGENLADLMWAVLMLPEFQIIR
jgi:hypothetical protein